MSRCSIPHRALSGLRATRTGSRRDESLGAIQHLQRVFKRIPQHLDRRIQSLGGVCSPTRAPAASATRADRRLGSLWKPLLPQHLVSLQRSRRKLKTRPERRRGATSRRPVPQASPGSAPTSRLSLASSASISAQTPPPPIPQLPLQLVLSLQKKTLMFRVSNPGPSDSDPARWPRATRALTQTVHHCF